MRAYAVQLGSDERRAPSRWSLRTVAGCFVLIAAILPWFRSAAGNDVQPRPASAIHAKCGLWDEQASHAIAALVQRRTDADLRQVADAIFRMRRARRNCEANWLNLACLDYEAIVRTAPGLALQQAGYQSACRSLIAGASPAAIPVADQR